MNAQGKIGMKTRIAVTVLVAVIGILIIWYLFRPGKCCASCTCRADSQRAAPNTAKRLPQYKRGAERRDPTPPRMAPRRQPPEPQAAPTQAPPTPAAKVPAPTKQSAPPAKAACPTCVGQTYEELGITDSHQ